MEKYTYIHAHYFNRFKALIFIALTFTSFSISASNNPPKKECENCFDTELVDISQEEGCITIELQINANNCNNALSHFVAEVPCGTITDAYNSGNWKMELDNTDPTTGITGIKVDDISNFGEDGQSGSFTLRYTVCSSDEECLNLLNSSFLVSYKAATCVFIDTIEITNTPLTADLVPTHLSCAGDVSGSIDLTITSGTPPYQIQWNTGATTEDLNNIPAGLYTVLITDATGQSLELSTEITEPSPIVITGNSTSASCSDNDGAIDVEVNGGNAPYTYNWNTGDTIQDLSNLASGYYLLTVTDANGCSKTNAFRISIQSTLAASVNSDYLACHEEGQGELTVSVAGGEEPYSYLWDNGDTTATATNLNSGSHSVIVTDSRGCSVEKNGYILLRRLNVTASVASPTCSNDTSGSISIDILNGTEPYDINWNTGDTTTTIDGLTEGWYWVEVTDANGCSYKKTIQVPGANSLSLTYTVANASCNEADSAIIITLNANGGTAPYEYFHNDTIITSPFIVDTEGNYDITVVDANGCTTTESVSVIRPESSFEASVMVKNPTCESPEFGSAEITVNQGISPFAASWSDGSNEMNRNNLAPGEYSVTISDSRGCSQSYAIEVENITIPHVEILPPDQMPECQSQNQVLNAITENTAQVNWMVIDSTNTWSITEDQVNYILYNTGDETTAQFIIEGISIDGCLHSDTIAIHCESGDTVDPEDPIDPDHNGDNDCSDSCYSVDAGSISLNQDGCYTYTFTVKTDGNCRHELSHLVIGIEDGTVTAASNSRGWKQELNLTDPTTGIFGFKIDDISGFGQSGTDQFDVTFQLCDVTGSTPQQFVIGYKSAQCIQADTIVFGGIKQDEMVISSYPNPFKDQTNIELIPEKKSEIELFIYDIHGNVIEHLYSGTVEEGIKYTFEFTTNTAGEGIYFYRLIYGDQVKQGKLLKY